MYVGMTIKTAWGRADEPSLDVTDTLLWDYEIKNTDAGPSVVHNLTKEADEQEPITLTRSQNLRIILLANPGAVSYILDHKAEFEALVVSALADPVPTAVNRGLLVDGDYYKPGVLWVRVAGDRQYNLMGLSRNGRLAWMRLPIEDMEGVAPGFYKLFFQEMVFNIPRRSGMVRLFKGSKLVVGDNSAHTVDYYMTPSSVISRSRSRVSADLNS